MLSSFFQYANNQASFTMFGYLTADGKNEMHCALIRRAALRTKKSCQPRWNNKGKCNQNREYHPTDFRHWYPPWSVTLPAPCQRRGFSYEAKIRGGQGIGSNFILMKWGALCQDATDWNHLRLEPAQHRWQVEILIAFSRIFLRWQWWAQSFGSVVKWRPAKSPPFHSFYASKPL